MAPSSAHSRSISARSPKPLIISFEPSAESALAMASPKPEVEPVTKATLPSRIIIRSRHYRKTRALPQLRAESLPLPDEGEDCGECNRSFPRNDASAPNCNRWSRGALGLSQGDTHAVR